MKVKLSPYERAISRLSRGDQLDRDLAGELEWKVRDTMKRVSDLEQRIRDLELQLTQTELELEEEKKKKKLKVTKSARSETEEE